MIYASTFLSHSSVDKPLVEAVAQTLGRRGIIAWLDRQELRLGANLSELLREAIERQVTTTAFISEAAVQSAWVTEELTVAIDTFADAGMSGRLLPVFIGVPSSLVRSHPLLRSRWLHRDGQRVNILGIQADAGMPVQDLAKTLSEGIASSVYQSLDIAAQREIILYLDHRGEGRRQGESQDMPESLRQPAIPALVFRPHLTPRSQSETLYGEAWRTFRDDITSSLAESIKLPRGAEFKSIYIAGNAQLGLAYLLGHYFNRSTSTYLFCYNRDGSVFTNRDQMRHAPLEGGNAHCESSHKRLTPLAENAKLETIALILTGPGHIDPALDYLAAQADAPQPVWVKHGLFQTNAEVMDHIADVVALLLRLRSDHQVSRVQLFCSLPFNVTPLLAANLLHVIDNVVFMEHRRDLQGQGASAGQMYTPLEMTR